MFTRLLTLLLMLTFFVTTSAQACRNGGGGGGGGKAYQGGMHHSRWQIPEEEMKRLNPTPVSGESLINGKALYQANCLRCHGEYAMGDGPEAASLTIRPANLRRTAHHHTDGAMSWMIRTGREPMPSWQDKLSQEQIWDLVNYVRFEIGGRMAHHYGGGRMAHQHGGGRMSHMTQQRGGERMTQGQGGCGGHKSHGGNSSHAMGGGRDAKREACEMQTASKDGDSDSQDIPDSKLSN